MLEIQFTKVIHSDFVRTHVNNQLVYCCNIETLHILSNSEIHNNLDRMQLG